ncbi:MAG: hypothetical protein ACTS8H_02175 [Arsenophonus sp. NC-PE1-MAG3]
MKRILITYLSVFIGLRVIYDIIEYTNDNVLVVNSLIYPNNIGLLVSVRGKPLLYAFSQINIYNRYAFNKIFRNINLMPIRNLAAENYID